MSETAPAAAIRASRLPRAARGVAGMPGAATLLSVSLHAAILCTLYLAMSPLVPPAAQSSVALAFEPPHDSPRATLAAETIPAAAATALDPLTSALPGRTVSATVADDHPRPARTAPAPPSASAHAQAPAPAAPTAPSPGDVAGLKLRIREAVRAATIYPAVARQLHREGGVQIGFTYRDGTVQGIALLHSSRSGLLDEAALAAVRRAAYPAPPPGLTGARLALDVWVNFGLKQE